MAKHSEEWDRLGKLVGRWQAHCRDAGHDTEAADCKYDRNVACTYIKCRAPGCSWKWDEEKHA